VRFPEFPFLGFGLEFAAQISLFHLPISRNGGLSGGQTSPSRFTIIWCYDNLTA
jgi:hypothetical protein